MPLDPTLLRLWAKTKPPHMLICHLLDAAAVCLALLPRFGSIDQLPDIWIAYLVALHDIGKADRLFQAKDETGLLVALLRDTGLKIPTPEIHGVKGFRHEARSSEWIVEHLKHDFGWGTFSSKAVRLAINGHHADFTASACNEEIPVKQIWNPLRNALASILRETLQVPNLKVDDWTDASEVGMRLSGLIVLSDWIASNERFYTDPRLPSIELDNWTPLAYFDAAKQVASDMVSRLGLAASAASSLPVQSFEHYWKFSPRSIQKIIVDAIASDQLPPGLVILEGPMGVGKTEGGIYLSEYWNQKLGATGAYVALPTQATSNQMHDRYRKFVKEAHGEALGPRLVHGMAWLIDDVEPEKPPIINNDNPVDPALAREWFASSKRALIAPYGVGTIDQVLRAALKVRYGFLRFLGLTRKVLIVDEVHACDEYMSTLLYRVLRWCRVLKIPVILMSATLASEQKRGLCAAYAGCEPGQLPAGAFDAAAEYPLVTVCPMDNPLVVTTLSSGVQDQPSRTVNIELVPGILEDYKAIAQLAVDRVEHGGCACVLVNTVKAAQAVFWEIKKLGKRQNAQNNLVVFHARFTAGTRLKIEKKVRKLFGATPDSKRPRRAILIATQVVEQSLDVDFDVMITQIAPIDLLLQRSGRLWRHINLLRNRFSHVEKLVVLTPGINEALPSFGNFRRVYEREWLLRTLAILRKNDRLTLPVDFRPLIEECFGNPSCSVAGIDPDDLMKARDCRIKAEGESKELAHTHLVPDPKLESFSYADITKPNEESNDGEAGTLLRPSTRLDDDSITVLLLSDPALIEATESADWPRRAVARTIYQQMVRLPGWWIENATPAEGFANIRKGEGWLRNVWVLPLVNGRWSGTRDNKEITIINDPKCGVYIDDEVSNE